MKIQIEFNPQEVASYRLIVYRIEFLELVTKAKQLRGKLGIVARLGQPSNNYTRQQCLRISSALAR